MYIEGFSRVPIGQLNAIPTGKYIFERDTQVSGARMRVSSNAIRLSCGAHARRFERHWSIGAHACRFERHWSIGAARMRAASNAIDPSERRACALFRTRFVRRRGAARRDVRSVMRKPSREKVVCCEGCDTRERK